MNNGLRQSALGLIFAWVIGAGSALCGQPPASSPSESSPSESSPSESSPSEASSPFEDLLDGITVEPLQPNDPANSNDAAMPSNPQSPSGSQNPTDSAASVDGSPLAKAYSAMVLAQQELESGDQANRVVEAQQTAIDALDTLLQQLQQSAPPESTAQSKPRPDPQQPEQSQTESRSEDDAAANPPSPQNGQDSPSEDPSQGVADTDPAALQHALQQSVWGHLPDRVRQQLQAAMPDEYHPRYRRAIAEYFRQLSQPSPPSTATGG